MNYGMDRDNIKGASLIPLENLSITIVSKVIVVQCVHMTYFCSVFATVLRCTHNSEVGIGHEGLLSSTDRRHSAG